MKNHEGKQNPALMRKSLRSRIYSPFNCPAGIEKIPEYRLTTTLSQYHRRQYLNHYIFLLDNISKNTIAMNL